VAISESEFEARADEILEHLMETLEKTLGDELDVDLDDGILSIELDSGGQYVINKHRPNRQIWMSSPASGASHFEYNADLGWVATRGVGNLVQILAQELSAATGRSVQFE
jgi:frataxin